jgi:hypothetical protein
MPYHCAIVEVIAADTARPPGLVAIARRRSASDLTSAASPRMTFMVTCGELVR